MSAQRDQVWLELPPISNTAPRRLLIFLHGAGQSADAFAPIAIAWQLKFPGATAIVMQGLRRFGERYDWFDPGPLDAQRQERIGQAARMVRNRIEDLQSALALSPHETTLIGHAQGAMLALELARSESACAGIVVAYAGRLISPLREGDRLQATVHLIHGEFDSVVPAVHATRAYRGMRAVGADVTLDIVEDESHPIGQDLVNLGTTRVMQTLFRGRRPATRRLLH